MNPQGVLEFTRPKTGWRPPSELPEFQPGERVAWDYESTGLNPFVDEPVGLAVYSGERKRGWYLPWGHRGGGNLDAKVVRRWAKDQLAKRELTGLNVKFECHMSRKFGLDLEKMEARPRDVAFNAALLNENRYSGYSLEKLAVEYLPEGERKQHPTTVDADKFYLAAAGEIAERAISDARLAFEIDRVTLPELAKQDLLRVLELENRCVLPVVEMETNGALIDLAKLRRWRSETAERIELASLALHHAVGFRVNPDSDKDMDRFFDALSLPKPKQWVEDEEERGQMKQKESFSAAALLTVDHPLVRDALALRRAKSIKSKYLDKYARAADKDGLIRYHLHQMRADDYGTVTGRFSCGGGEHAINIQQVMKVDKQIEKFGDEFIVRELFVPAPGRLFFASDASQIEFRLFAHFANSARLVQAYRDNPRVDFHDMVMEMIREFVAIERWAAKNINFGKLYGMGLAKLCASLNLSESEGKRLVALYEKAFPESTRLINRASRLAKQTKFVRTYLGRRRRFPDGRGLHAALNAVLQGTAADYFKTKLRELWEERKQLEITLRMPVHDEFAGDISPDPKKKKLLVELLDSQSFDLRVPLLWDTKTGDDWRLSKGSSTNTKNLRDNLAHTREQER